MFPLCYTCPLVRIGRPGALYQLQEHDYNSIRPVVNWRNAPPYKLSKLFIRKVNQLAPLPHSFNKKNAQDLLKDPSHTLMLPHNNLASIDITILYSNIPVKETKMIFANILTHNLIDPPPPQNTQKKPKVFATFKKKKNL